MDRLWLRMAQIYGLSRWAELRGGAGGEEYLRWTAALEDLTEEQIARGVRNAMEGDLSDVPTSGAFRTLCLTELHRPPERIAKPEPPAPPRKAGPSEVELRERDRQARIGDSPRSREAQDTDVESFLTSWHNCGLGHRWPGGKVAL